MHLARLLTLLAALLLCAPSHAQTIKSLGYNTTNGFVVYGGTNLLTFTNNVGFSSGRIEIGGGLGFWDATAAEYALFFQSDEAVILSESRWNDPSVRASLGFSTNLNTLWTATTSSNARSAVGLGATWLTNTDADTFRSNIGLGLSALTNTSNVTAMRALAGSTNTNAPFSGSVSVVGTNNTNTLVFSNGILLEVTAP